MISATYELPDDISPEDPALVHLIVERTVRGLSEFNRQELAEEMVAEIAQRYPIAWEKYTRPSEVSMLLHSIRSAFASIRREAGRAEVMSIAHQKARHRFGSVDASDVHYAVGKDRYKRLRLMNRHEIEATASHMESSARGMLNRSLVLRAIAKKLPNADAVVGDYWTDEQLVAMFGGEVPDIDVA